MRTVVQCKRNNETNVIYSSWICFMHIWQHFFFFFLPHTIKDKISKIRLSKNCPFKCDCIVFRHKSRRLNEGCVILTRLNYRSLILNPIVFPLVIQIYRWILYHVVLYTSRLRNSWPQPWHPSNLVYSRCKAEVAWNKQSNPEYNPFGKYWLKLFFMVSSHVSLGVTFLVNNDPHWRLFARDLLVAW